jgi:hypothetical protein
LSSPRVIERRADLVFPLEDESILHLECQARNDKEMPYREGIFCLLLGRKYRRRVRQVVIYLGEAKMRMIWPWQCWRTAAQRSFRTF